MKTAMLEVKCITNLHIGTSGNVYGDIKSEVEKDAILGTPILPSSGIKGALRDFWRENDKEDEIVIFGSNPEEKTENGQRGNCKFVNGHLLFRPMRVSEGDCAYCLVTTPELLNIMLETAKNFDVNLINDDISIDDLKTSLVELKIELNECQDQVTAAILCSSDCFVKEVEGYDVKKIKNNDNKLCELLMQKSNGVPVVIMKTEFFQMIDLPIVARNYLKEGKSSNLWYEEIVPHQSYFYFVVLWKGDKDEIFSDFIEEICKGPISLGGNNSVGNGYCIITKINKEKDNESNGK